MAKVAREAATRSAIYNAHGRQSPVRKKMNKHSHLCSVQSTLRPSDCGPATAARACSHPACLANSLRPLSPVMQFGFSFRPCQITIKARFSQLIRRLIQAAGAYGTRCPFSPSRDFQRRCRRVHTQSPRFEKSRATICDTSFSTPTALLAAAHASRLRSPCIASAGIRPHASWRSCRGSSQFPS